MDEIERILTSDEILTPSSGFAPRVMDAVRDAAAEPPPLPFPWGRLAVGVIANVLGGVSGAALVMLRDVPAASAVTSRLVAVAPELCYAAVASLASFGLLQANRLFSTREP